MKRQRRRRRSQDFETQHVELIKKQNSKMQFACRTVLSMAKSEQRSKRPKYAMQCNEHELVVAE